MRFVLPTTYARTRIYRPKRESVEVPSLTHADLKTITVRTDDDLSLNGWYTLSSADSDGPRPLVVYFPGASGHRGFRVDTIEMLSRLGCDVLLVDYRGYGDNDGQPTEKRQAGDARAVWQFAVEQLHVPPERIVLYGESIGGGVATRLASTLCRQGTEPAGLIMQATFACMLDVVSQFFPRFLSRIFLVDRFPSIRLIRRVTCPILSIHGDKDRLIPIAMGRRLFDAAPAESSSGWPKQFLQLSGIDHNDIIDEAGEEVAAALHDFLSEAVPEAVEQSDVPQSGVMQPLQ